MSYIVKAYRGTGKKLKMIEKERAESLREMHELVAFFSGHTDCVTVDRSDKEFLQTQFLYIKEGYESIICPEGSKVTALVNGEFPRNIKYSKEHLK